jgi:hypothetical protein
MFGLGCCAFAGATIREANNANKPSQMFLLMLVINLISALQFAALASPSLRYFAAQTRVFSAAPARHKS